MRWMLPALVVALTFGACDKNTREFGAPAAPEAHESHGGEVAVDPHTGLRPSASPTAAIWTASCAARRNGGGVRVGGEASSSPPISITACATEAGREGDGPTFGAASRCSIPISKGC